jgi:hypothetical protein
LAEAVPAWVVALAVAVAFARAGVAVVVFLVANEPPIERGGPTQRPP